MIVDQKNVRMKEFSKNFSNKKNISKKFQKSNFQTKKMQNF
jgi:hypothetical protein